MLTEPELAVIHRARKKFALVPPSAALLLKIAARYKRWWAEWDRIYEGVDKVRGLDEFHPKHVKWENSLFYAECKKDMWADILLAAARAVRWPHELPQVQRHGSHRDRQQRPAVRLPSRRHGKVQRRGH